MNVKKHLKRLEDINDSVKRLVDSYDVDAKYSLEHIEYYVDTLFSMCPLSHDDEVEFVKTPACALREDSGWYTHRHLMEPGCRAKVAGVDHRNGHFVVDVLIVVTSFFSSFEKKFIELPEPQEMIFPCVGVDCLKKIPKEEDDEPVWQVT